MAMSGFIGILFVTTISVLPTPSLGFQFYVGGKDGWVLNPSELYAHWSQRNRFQVNDTLYFKYNEDGDSVKEVTKDDYNSCNNKSPMHAMKDGDTVVTLDRSGPYYFISGNMENCHKGQKLFLVVMAVTHSKPPIHPPVSPVKPSTSPLAASPQTTPTSEAQSPAPVPSVSSSLAPGVKLTRIYAPVPAPMANTASASSGLAISVLSLLLVGFL